MFRSLTSSQLVDWNKRWIAAKYKQPNAGFQGSLYAYFLYHYKPATELQWIINRLATKPVVTPPDVGLYLYAPRVIHVPLPSGSGILRYQVFNDNPVSVYMWAVRSIPQSIARRCQHSTYQMNTASFTSIGPNSFGVYNVTGLNRKVSYYVRFTFKVTAASCCCSRTTHSRGYTS